MTTTMTDLQSGRTYVFNEALPGRDAYEEALAAGFEGDRAAWLAHLRGFAFNPATADWEVDRLYSANNAVRHANKLWVAAVEDLGTEPGTDAEVWVLLLDGPDPEDVADIATHAAAIVAAAEETGQNLATSESLLAQVEAKRAEAEANKDLTYGYAQDVASAVVYQNLAAMVASKAVTAVDIIIYDTTRDSDGGAWRHRCQHTAWYNETLNTASRGARREFPAVAVIIVDAAKVTIYDADDPALPMWRVEDYTGLTLRRVAALNGKLAITSTSGVVVSDYAKDRLGSTTPNYTASTSPAILLNSADDVTMAVLPGAPTDPSTGLPVPTIWVAQPTSSGGISTIKSDGTVANAPDVKGANRLVFDPTTNNLIYTESIFNVVTYALLYPGYTSSATVLGNVLSDPQRLWANGTWGRHVFSAPGELLIAGPSAIGGTYSGLQRVLLSGTTALANLYTTAAFCTGWMWGSIRGCWLSSKETASLVEAELIPNSDFDTGDLSGWQNNNVTLGVSGGSLEIAAVSTPSHRGARAFTTVVGQQYLIYLRNVSAAISVRINTGNTIGAGTSIAFGGNGTLRDVMFWFTATTTSYIVQLELSSSTSGTVDKISVRAAAPDRSIQNRGLIPNGTITQASISHADGLALYRGGSDSDFFSQPYNAVLNFGTAAWEIATILRQAANSAEETLFERNSPTPAAGWKLVVTAAGYLSLVVTDGTTTRTATGSVAIDDGSVHHVVCGYDGAGGVYIKVDGAAYASASGAALLTLNNAAAELRVFRAMAGGSPSVNGEMGNLKPSTTPMSVDQHAFTYASEAPLRQGHACTLYGASDAVVDLAHDRVTGLLHAGTSSGRSDFRGLRRVANTNTAVSTRIAAAGGLIAEQ